jgi:hypothetical protein
MNFLDLNGRTYAIPDDVLAKHEVKGALPAVPLTGLEIAPETDVTLQGGYSWRIQNSPDGHSLHYVLSAQQAPDLSTDTASATDVTVLIRNREFVIRFGDIDEKR